MRERQTEYLPLPDGLDGPLSGPETNIRV